MKYTSKQYAVTLISALAGKSEDAKKDILKKFLIILQRNGDLGKRNQILEEVRREYFRQNDLSKVEVEVVGKIKEGLKQEIEESLGKAISFDSKVNPKILGGIKILIDDETLIDASVKTQLDKLFIINTQQK